MLNTHPLVSFVTSISVRIGVYACYAVNVNGRISQHLLKIEFSKMTVRSLHGQSLKCADFQSFHVVLLYGIICCP